MSTLVLTAKIDSNGILDLKDLSPMVIMMVIYFYAFRSSAVDKRQLQNAMGSLTIQILRGIPRMMLLKCKME